MVGPSPIETRDTELISWIKESKKSQGSFPSRISRERPGIRSAASRFHHIFQIITVPSSYVYVDEVNNQEKQRMMI